MANDNDPFVDDLIKMNEQLRKLNGTFTSKVNIDVSEIKKKLTEEIKRETLGRTSYGLGV